jgi:cytochrome c
MNIYAFLPLIGRRAAVFTLSFGFFAATVLDLGLFAQQSGKVAPKAATKTASKAPAKPKPAVVTAGNAKNGQNLFQQCQACHATASNEARFGPGLKGLYKKAKMKNGKAPTDANVLQLINEGVGSMPAYGDIFSDKEKRDMVAYLKTL